MSPSSDIETLFGHFGGNASDYQEIGRENDAATARTRWPLLVTLDLNRQQIPVVGEPGEQAAADASRAQPEAGAAVPPGFARTDPHAPVDRKSAPLFARSPRRDMPPVLNFKKPEPLVQRGAARFSLEPQLAAVTPLASASAASTDTASQLSASQATPPAQSAPATLVAAPIAAAVTPAVTPAATPAQTAQALLVAQAAQTAQAVQVAQIAQAAQAARAAQAAQPAQWGVAAAQPTPHAAPQLPWMQAPAAIPATHYAAPAQPAFNAPSAWSQPVVTMTDAATPSFAGAPARGFPATAPAAAPMPAAAPAQNPPSMLSRLFGGGNAARQAEPAAPLQSMFDRLRAPAPAAAQPVAQPTPGAYPTGPFGAPVSGPRTSASHSDQAANGTRPAAAPHSWLVNGPRRP
ncbi:cellulose biosynthesis protein BcsP [Paraburkholderia sp.]|uniref:cellulose biosynthesis protein BcsP n=1 Tax=Paraburkholderia sp. TaxID=1926495 RepID=UPI00239C5F04|nr:cellulose biosynthesis protein BcsP [Paraburkholderia sp.]MDE1181075.1 cellulose biosynthesis protein BcsP [Paraburkholderia sp.]